MSGHLLPDAHPCQLPMSSFTRWEVGGESLIELIGDKSSSFRIFFPRPSSPLGNRKPTGQDPKTWGKEGTESLYGVRRAVTSLLLWRCQVTSHRFSLDPGFKHPFFLVSTLPKPSAYPLLPARCLAEGLAEAALLFRLCFDAKECRLVHILGGGGI